MFNLLRRLPIFFFITIFHYSFAQNTNPCIAQKVSQKPIHIVVLGSSTAAGVGAAPSSKSWVELYTAFLKTQNPSNRVTNLAKGGFSLNFIMPTAHPYGDWANPDTARNITKALSLKPDAIVIALASNDAGLNRGPARQLKQFKEIIDSARIKKVLVWVTTTQPRKFGTSDFFGYKIQQDMQDTLKKIYGVYSVDFWSDLSRPDPGLPGSIFLTKKYFIGDSIHPNNEGHVLLYQRIFAKDILTSLVIAQDKNLKITGSLNCGQPTIIQIIETQQSIKYYLKKEDGTSVSGPLVGDGSSKSFSISIPGNYKIVAHNDALNCERDLTTPVSIANGQGGPLKKTVTVLNTPIASGSSAKIRIALSEVGVTYRLQDLADADYSSGVGNGGNLDLSTGNISTTKKFKVIATNGACSITFPDTLLVTVIKPANMVPLAEILTPVSGTKYKGGESISFSGNGTDIEDGLLPGSAFSWKVNLIKGNAITAGPSIPVGVKTGSFAVPVAGETSANVFYRLYLVVKDSEGATDTSFVDILPNKSTLSFITQPPGLKVKLDDTLITTPYATSGVQGIQRTIGVLTPQTFAGKSFIFSHWLQGGNATQTISTPTSDETYTAVFTEDKTPQVNGLNYSYYEGNWTKLPDFEALSPIKTGITANIDLTLRNREVNYGFKFIGYLDVPATATYTIFLKSDDGGKLFIDNTVIIDNDGNHAAWERSINLNLTIGKHAIKVIYFQREYDQVLTLNWTGPNFTKQPIPSARFFIDHDASQLRIVEEENTPPIENDFKETALLYPNPSKDKLKVSLYANKGEKVKLAVIDPIGVIQKQDLLSAEVQGTNVFEIDVNALKNNTYILKIQKGKSLLYKHFIINQ